MLKPTGLDRTAVRTAFEIRRDPAERADFLLREVERRLLERMDPIRLEPVARVLDLGCGHGASFGPLAVRHPGARLLGGDLAAGTLAASAGRPGHAERLRDGARRWLARLGIGSDEPPPATEPWRIGLDAHALPFAADSIDLLWSNLALHWLDDPLAALAEWQRVVRPGGLVIFSAFGVDTLREARGGPLRPNPDGSRPPTCWPSLQDMHDWGDALVAAGFAEPVLETETLTLTYAADPAADATANAAAAADAVDADADADAAAAAADRYRADVEAIAMLSGPERDAFRARPPARTLTLELVYGHAWAPQRKRRADGLATVEFHRDWRRR